MGMIIGGYREGTQSAQQRPYDSTPNSEPGAVCWPPQASTLSRYQHWSLSQFRATRLHLSRGINEVVHSLELSTSQAWPGTAAANTNILRRGSCWERQLSTQGHEETSVKNIGWELAVRWRGEGGLL